jgi:hypothetical protein
MFYGVPVINAADAKLLDHDNCTVYAAMTVVSRVFFRLLCSFCNPALSYDDFGCQSATGARRCCTLTLFYTEAKLINCLLFN